tara:strand:- start:97 stop:345 length:249 start_codon:yes stop_codon:yes gene_type:complete
MSVSCVPLCSACKIGDFGTAKENTMAETSNRAADVQVNLRIITEYVTNQASLKRRAKPTQSSGVGVEPSLKSLIFNRVSPDS